MDDLLGNLDVLERSVEHFVECILGNLVDGCLYGEVVFLQDGLYLPEHHLVLVVAERCNAALVDGERTVGDDLVDVDLVDIAKALAGGAGTFGRIKRELVGCRVAIRDAACGAHQALGVVFGNAGFLVEHHQQPVALLHGGGNTLSEPFLVAVGDGHLVYHHLDVVVLVAVDLHSALYFLHLSVDTNIEVSLAAHAFEEFAIVALSVPDQRGKYEDAFSLVVVVDHLDHLLFGVLHHQLARHVAVGLAGTGKEQTEIVVDLGGGAYGGTGILVGGFLLDADDGRQSGNLVNIGALHASQEVAGIGREGFYVAALALGENGVEGK